MLFSYPTFSDNDDILIQNLSDPLLLLTAKKTTDVIAHTIEEQKSTGTILFGENGSGKTVYLRSIGTAQLLAQAGLPIPADKADMRLYTQVVTQFSEGEKEFERGNDAGRLEQEVRELHMVVDTLRSGALVLLNETFQTTAYAEGAEGLIPILDFFWKPCTFSAGIASQTVGKRTFRTCSFTSSHTGWIPDRQKLNIAHIWILPFINRSYPCCAVQNTTSPVIPSLFG